MVMDGMSLRVIIVVMGCMMVGVIVCIRGRCSFIIIGGGMKIMWFESLLSRLFVIDIQIVSKLDSNYYILILSLCI